jgi:hypothetical protein
MWLAGACLGVDALIVILRYSRDLGHFCSLHSSPMPPPSLPPATLQVLITLTHVTLPPLPTLAPLFPGTIALAQVLGSFKKDEE